MTVILNYDFRDYGTTYGCGVHPKSSADLVNVDFDFIATKLTQFESDNNRCKIFIR